MTEAEIMKALKWCELFTDNIVLSNKKGEKFTFALQSLQTIKQVLKEYNRKNAEIEKFADIGKLYSEIKAEARAEAIKEFAERVKESLDISCCGYSTEEVREDVFDTIDGVAANMRGKL